VGPRCVSFLRRADFLDLARTVLSGLPALLTAGVDRRRRETHTFHLLCGEMTISLQDVGLILGLGLHGLPVTGRVDPDSWRDLVEEFCAG
jgi:hypothetical protein